MQRCGAWAALAAGLVVAACGSSEPSHGSPVVRATAGPIHTVTLAQPSLRRIPVPAPDGLVFVAGRVFVKTDSGLVVRIDPASNRVTGQVKLDTATDPSHYCQGIGTDGTSVWACAAEPTTTAVVQLDPPTLHVLARVELDKVFDQLSLPHNARGIWVLVDSGHQLAVIDARSRAVSRYPLPARCLQVAVTDTRVVVTCSTENRVLLLDAGNGRVVAATRVASPRLATFFGQDVWVDSSDGLTRMDASLRRKAVFPRVTADTEGDLVATDDAVWLRAGEGSISKLDPERNALLTRYQLPQPLSTGSLLVTPDSFWTSSNDDGYVVRISR